MISWTYCLVIPDLVSLLVNLPRNSFKQAIVVQSLSCVQLFVTQWTAACQASLSFTISRNLSKFTFIELVMPSNHLIPLLPSSPSYACHLKCILRDAQDSLFVFVFCFFLIQVLDNVQTIMPIVEYLSHNDLNPTMKQTD